MDGTRKHCLKQGNPYSEKQTMDALPRRWFQLLAVKYIYLGWSKCAYNPGNWRGRHRVGGGLYFSVVGGQNTCYDDGRGHWDRVQQGRGQGDGRKGNWPSTKRPRKPL